MPPTDPRQIILVLDEDDWNAIQAEFAERQSFRRDDGQGGTEPMLPEGESNLAGAMVGEIVRDLKELRDLWEKGHPHAD